MFFLDNHDYFLYTCHIANYSVCMYVRQNDRFDLFSINYWVTSRINHRDTCTSKIIAQYLFNKDEDKLYFDLIKELKAYHDSKKDKL